VQKKGLVYLFITIIFLFLSYSICLFFNESTVVKLTGEDGLFETLSAIFFLLVSVSFFYLFFKSKSGNNFYFYRTRKNVLFLLLAFMFLFAFGEEISWGQRIFSFETPKALKNINLQGEFNIHNIDIFHTTDPAGNRKSIAGLLLNLDRIFSLFWLSWCVIIPVLSKLHKRFCNWLKEVGVPIIPIWLGFLFISNYLLSKVGELFISSANLPNNPLVEIKEYNFAFLFFLVCIYCFKEVSIDIRQYG